MIRTAKFFLLSILPLFLVAHAHAEFIKTSAHVYQAGDQKGRVIISQRVPGLYFTASSAPIDIQQFDPSNVKNVDSDDAFVRYDPTLNKYTTLIVRDKQFKINGSFVLHVGSLKITIDNQNPYCSIINEEGGTQGPSVLGFHGTLEVVNAQGQEAVALFEANQFNDHRALVKPYLIEKGALTVGGAVVSNAFVGVVMQDKNICLGGDAVVLEESVALSWGTLDEAQKASAIAAARSKRNPLLKLLRLRTTKESIVAFDYLRARMKSIKPVDAQQNAVCGIFPLEIKNS